MVSHVGGFLVYKQKVCVISSNLTTRTGLRVFVYVRESVCVCVSEYLCVYVYKQKYSTISTTSIGGVKYQMYW